MKKRNILCIFLFCLLNCTESFANDIEENMINMTVTHQESTVTMREFLGITDVSDISMICIDSRAEATVWYIANKDEIRQAYHILMNMPIEKVTDSFTYFEIENKYEPIQIESMRHTGTIILPSGGERYYAYFYIKNNNEPKTFYISDDKLYTANWVLSSGGKREEGKANDFYKWLENIEAKKQKYEWNLLNETDLYQNKVIVDLKELTYQWGKPYINEKNQIMVPFRELNTALNTQATYDVKTQMVSVRKKEPVPLYGEVTDEVVYVAARDLATLGGYDIYWDDELKIAYITQSTAVKMWTNHQLLDYSNY